MSLPNPPHLCTPLEKNESQRCSGKIKREKGKFNNVFLLIFLCYKMWQFFAQSAVSMFAAGEKWISKIGISKVGMGISKVGMGYAHYVFPFNPMHLTRYTLLMLHFYIYLQIIQSKGNSFNQTGNERKHFYMNNTNFNTPITSYLIKITVIKDKLSKINIPPLLTYLILRRGQWRILQACNLDGTRRRMRGGCSTARWTRAGRPCWRWTCQQTAPGTSGTTGQHSRRTHAALRDRNIPNN